MKRLIVLAFGLVFTAILTGCCCLPGCGTGCGYGGGCGPGGCSVPGSTIPAGAMYSPPCSSCTY